MDTSTPVPFAEESPIIESENFRVGFPSLPQPRVGIENPSADDERIDIWNRCSKKAASILQNAGLDFKKLHLKMTKGKNDTVFHPTIMISVASRDDWRLWQPTLIQVAEMLKEQDALDVHVLVMEPDGEPDRCHAYIIDPNLPIKDLWNDKLGSAVVDVLESEDVGFNELCVWNWGVSEEEAEPTVVLVVDDKREREWEGLVERIKGICAEHGAPDLKVVVEEGRHY